MDDMLFTGAIQVYFFPDKKRAGPFQVGNRMKIRFFGVRGSQRVVWRGDEPPQIFLIDMFYPKSVDIHRQISVGDVLYIAGDIHPNVQVNPKTGYPRFGVFLNAQYYQCRVMGKSEVTPGAIEMAKDRSLRRMNR